MFGLSAADIIVIITLIASAATGIRRGFTTEAMKLVTWAGAIFITVIAQPAAFNFMSRFLTVDLMANIAGLVIVFVISLVSLNFLGKFIGERVKTSFIGPIDRLLGVVFGFIRGVIVVSAAYLAFSSFIPEKAHPNWITQARLLPYVKIGATVIAEVTPDIFDSAGKALGYDDEEREEMDDLVEDVSGEG